MAVSGHKSLSSLAVYQRVCDDEKLMMGMKLTFNLLRPDEAKCIKEIVLHQQQEEQLQIGDETSNKPPKKSEGN